MNKMNRKVEYALMALKFMSQINAGQLTSVKEICQSTGAPFDATYLGAKLAIKLWRKKQPVCHQIPIV
jgi:hypothetical protein